MTRRAPLSAGRAFGYTPINPYIGPLSLFPSTRFSSFSPSRSRSLPLLLAVRSAGRARAGKRKSSWARLIDSFRDSHRRHGFPCTAAGADRRIRRNRTPARPGNFEIAAIGTRRAGLREGAREEERVGHSKGTRELLEPPLLLRRYVELRTLHDRLHASSYYKILKVFVE